MGALISDSWAAADATPATDAATQASGAAVPYELSAEKMMTDNLLVLAMLFFVFYFLLIRPQSRRVKIQRDMMKALQKGDKVLTGGGIIGTITKFEGDDIVVVEIAQGLTVRVTRSSISEIMGDKAAQGKSANDN